MKAITGRQHAVLKAITSFQVDHDGLSPSMADIRQAVGIKSDNAISKHLTALLRKGAITQRMLSGRAASRSIGITTAARAKLAEKWASSDLSIQL